MQSLSIRVVLGLAVVLSLAVGTAEGAGRRAQAPTPAAIIARAEQGDPVAQAQLGFMYQIGRGVPQSYAEAARWQMRAACQGDTRAQYLIGLLYDKGHGVPQDYVMAYMWLALASAAAPSSWANASMRARDAVATKMSPMALAKAQYLAVTFRPAPERM